MRGADVEAAEFGYDGVRDWVFREDGDVGSVKAEAGDGYGYVGFTAAEGCDELRALEEALKTGGREAQHDFTEGDYFAGHNFLPVDCRRDIDGEAGFDGG